MYKDMWDDHEPREIKYCCSDNLSDIWTVTYIIPKGKIRRQTEYKYRTKQWGIFVGLNTCKIHLTSLISQLDKLRDGYLCNVKLLMSLNSIEPFLIDHLGFAAANIAYYIKMLGVGMNYGTT